jgi:UDP-glucose 4-epimerase
MHLLVTGAGGFVGAEMVLALLARGHRITAAVGSGRGRLPQNAERLGVLKIVSGDLSIDMRLPDSIDAVVHAAARSIWPGVTVAAMVRDNVGATARLISHARRSGVKRFIFLSSLSVYGKISVSVVDEATPIIDPDAYGLTKRLGEEMLKDAADSFPSLSMRLPGVIGRGSVRNWLTSVMEAARAGREITVFNPDAPFNNAVHVADLGEFVCNLLERERTGADIVTLGAAGQASIREVVQSLCDSFGGQSRLRIETATKPGFVVSSDRANKFYGYGPMDIAEMLMRFAAENTIK